MVVITADNYANAGVHTITVKNEELFRVKMNDVEKGIGVKKISNLVLYGIKGIYETKQITEEQKKKI